MNLIRLFTTVLFITGYSCSVSALDIRIQSAMPIEASSTSQYSCLEVMSQPYFYSKKHYYFPPFRTPTSLPFNSGGTVCHDTLRYGEEDSPLFPRLELDSRAFSLWSTYSRAFADMNRNGQKDVNEYIQSRLLFEYDTVEYIDLFRKLELEIGPIDPEVRLGYLMSPFFDSETGQSFCPTNEHYERGEPIFTILRDVLGAETEGLYKAKREPLSMSDPNGSVVVVPNDYIYIKESTLKNIWFYVEDGIAYPASDEIAKDKSLHFYYPINVASPFIRGPGQKLYTLQQDHDYRNGSALTHDKKFGCIPKSFY